jgi:predicted cation transporter
VASILAGYFARGSHYEGPVRLYIRESPKSAVIEGFRVYVFVAGLALVSHQYAALAATMVAGMSSRAFFWVNTVSAILDNATLVALEIHKMPLERARDAIIALLVSGGMLIPGNIPNVVSASALTIRSGAWARVGVPSG